jgi:hypothetical protein
MTSGRWVAAWLALATLATAGCAAGYAPAAALLPGENAMPETETAGAGDKAALKVEAGEREAATPVGGAGGAVDKRTLIRDAALVIAAANPEESVRRAEAAAEKLGGYAQSETLSEAVLRVPAARFDEALEALAKLGPVASRAVQVWDVTEAYTDLEIQLKGKQATLARFQEILKKAEKVEEVLKIETEVARLATEIEQLEGKLRLMKSQVAMSRIAVRFERSTAVAAQQRHIELPFSWLQTIGLEQLMARY